MTNQRGNILFIILIAIILFVALTYAINSSMQGGGNDASNESAQAKTSELLNYFTQLDSAVQRMMLTGGVKDYELNFYYQDVNKFIQSGYDNVNCTESRCRVFDPAGGAVSGKQLLNFNRAGVLASRIYYMAVRGVGSDKQDIAYTIFGVPVSTCLEVNKRIGLNDILYGVTWNNAPVSSFHPYGYAFPAGPIADTTAILSVPAQIGSTGTFCICNLSTRAACEADSNWPAIYHVLVAR